MIKVCAIYTKIRKIFLYVMEQLFDVVILKTINESMDV